MKISREVLARAAAAVASVARVNKWLDGRSREEHMAEAAIEAAMTGEVSVPSLKDYPIVMMSDWPESADYGLIRLEEP